MKEGRTVSTLIRDLTLRASASDVFCPSDGDKALMRDAVLLLHELNMGRLLRVRELEELKLLLDEAVAGAKVEPSLDAQA